MSLGSFASPAIDSKRQRAVPLPHTNAHMKTFTPDSSIASDVIPSANYGDRNKGRLPDMILLHYTGMPDVEGAIARLCTAGTDVSAHYIVLEDGRIVQCVPEAKRAWHAGVSSWRGRSACNDFSVGIELEGTDQLPYEAAQYRALAALIRSLRKVYPSLEPDGLAGHADIAPGRKTDPGDAFDWNGLAALLA